MTAQASKPDADQATDMSGNESESDGSYSEYSGSGSDSEEETKIVSTPKQVGKPVTQAPDDSKVTNPSAVSSSSYTDTQPLTDAKSDRQVGKQGSPVHDASDEESSDGYDSYVESDEEDDAAP